MAGLWADAPDYYSIAEVTRVWTSFTNNNAAASLVAGAGRRAGTAAWRTVTGGAKAAVWSKTLAPTGDCIITFAFKLRATPSAGGTKPFFGIFDATVMHICVMVNTDNTLAFYRGGVLGSSPGTLIGATTMPLNLNVFYSLSIRTKIDTAAGTLSCRINRNEALNGGAGYSGINTRNGGTAAWSKLTWTSNDIDSPSFDFTDVVACDSSGARNNDHPGDCAVAVQLPLVGNGGCVDWTPSAGTDHGAMVDDGIPNDDGDYNQAGVAGLRDTYVYPAASVALGTPRFLITRPCLKLAVAGSQNVVDVQRKAGVNFDGATPQAPGAGSYNYFDFIREVDPATGLPWTIAGINATESGVKTL